ncbi:MAG TPA: SPOR domain-containing protein [Terracidiphilus sp.]|jgi:cell division septation protein DedD
MIRDFSKEELEPTTNDAELTLGVGAFLTMGAGLLLICGICFGLGYAVGHRGTPDQGTTAMLPSQDTKAVVTPTGSGTKPGAATQVPVQSQAEAASGTPNDENGAEVAQGAAGAGSTQVADPSVHPALTTQTQPPRNQVPGWMVQIAAVSHPEDAQVLVDALRKRGYEVTARRDVSDNLIHVRTGPFVNRNDANAMRQKLLSDGYNAIVQ